METRRAMLNGAESISQALPHEIRRAVRAVGHVPKDEARWPARYVELCEVAAAALRDIPDGTDTERQASALVLALAIYEGSGRHHWPRAERIRGAARDWRIYHREFDGRNAAALAARYGMTVRAMTRLLARQRKFEKEARERRRERCSERPPHKVATG